ncbi:P63C domain-containing protein [Pseudomonas sp. NPDC077649]|uniref:P63C domain-containing protein n=1 Tax=Pseudomonas sp. NPDC077649 TaxID=3364423 RepID=UPI0037CCBCFC
MSDSSIQLVHSAGEARVDSRLLADQLKTDHASTIKLIRKYLPDFHELGPIGFEIQKGKPLPQGGFAKATEFALLNEDQSYLLLAYSRNTKKVRALKVNLVKAFRDARHRAGLDSMMNLVLLPAPAPWEKRFSDAYYQALAHITGTVFAGHSCGTPAIFGQITDRWVYAAILPKEVHRELKARRGDSEKMHQWLTDGGRERLDQQIAMVTVIAKSSSDRKDFEARCMQTFGMPGQLRIIYPV